MTKNYGLSDFAADRLDDAKGSLACAFPMRYECAASASHTVEFLVWWFEQTRHQDWEGKPNHRDWKAKTGRGRPSVGEHTAPIPPSKLREGTGLDPVVQRRKL